MIAAQLRGESVVWMGMWCSREEKSLAEVSEKSFIPMRNHHICRQLLEKKKGKRL
jgi:hypothetical protein